MRGVRSDDLRMTANDVLFAGRDVKGETRHLFIVILLVYNSVNENGWPVAEFCEVFFWRE